MSYLRRQGETFSSVLNSVAQEILCRAEFARDVSLPSICPGADQRGRRRSFSSPSGDRGRVDPPSRGLRHAPQEVASDIRSVCVLSESTLWCLFCSCLGSHGCRYRCHAPVLGLSHGLRVDSSGVGEAASFSRCVRLRSSLAFSGPCGPFLVSCVWGRVIQSLTLLFFPDCLFLFSGLGLLEVVIVFHQGQPLSALCSIDFSLPGLGEHYVLQDLIWFLAIGWLPCLLCGVSSSSCPTFFLLTLIFRRSSESGLDWDDFVLCGSRRCHEDWQAPGSLYVCAYVTGDFVVSFLPHFMARMERADAPLPCIVLVRPLQDFAWALEDGSLLCPMRALRAYLDQPQSAVARSLTLFVLPLSPHRAISQNAVSSSCERSFRVLGLSGEMKALPCELQHSRGVHLCCVFAKLVGFSGAGGFFFFFF